MKTLSLSYSVSFSNALPFVLIAGPCVLENREHSLMLAEKLSLITQRLGIPFVFKSSFDKANRTSYTGARGVGMDAGLQIFEEIKKRFALPIITDVHLPEQCAEVASVADILQIPAFLCRQTDLLRAAAETGKFVNVKKGQFLAPHDMKQVVKKLEHFGSEKILLCERGFAFGYNRLVVDMCSLSIMAQTGYPVVFDATHSIQEPGGGGTKTSGNRLLAPILARAALAVGVASIFAEVHDNPDMAPSDGPNMLKLSELEGILKEWQAIDCVAKQMPRSLEATS